MAYVAANVPLAYSVVTPPAAEPVDVSTLRAHLREVRTENQARVIRNGASARHEVETKTRRQLMPATYDLFLPGFADEIRVVRSPLLSVSSISYVDQNGDTQTLATSVYTVDASTDPGRIYRAYNQTWPVTRSIEKAVTVRFVAGYSSSAVTDTARAAIPGLLIDAILLKAELLYDAPDGPAADALHRAFADAIAPFVVPLTPVAVLTA